MGRRRLEPNVVTFNEEIVYIHLRGKTGEGKVAIVDKDSYFKYILRDYVWVMNQNGYVMATDPKTYKIVLMHRIVAENDTTFHTDHINRVRHDNRKENLRICTAVDNNYNAEARVDNKHGYKNVTEQYGKYRCFIRVNKIKQSFGSYAKPEMAALAYNIAMKLLSPEYALLNNIPQDELTQEEIELVSEKVSKRMEQINKKYDLLG